MTRKQGGAAITVAGYHGAPRSPPAPARRTGLDITPLVLREPCAGGGQGIFLADATWTLVGEAAYCAARGGRQKRRQIWWSCAYNGSRGIWGQALVWN